MICGIMYKWPAHFTFESQSKDIKSCYLHPVIFISLLLLRMNKRRKNNIFGKIVDFPETIEIKKKRSSTIKNLLLQRTKLNHSLLKTYNSLDLESSFLKEYANEYDSKTHFYQYRSIAMNRNSKTNCESIEKQMRMYNNNYKAFPRRSLLVKPHMAKNINMSLNVPNKRMDQSGESSNTIFTKTLYVQFTEENIDPKRTISSAHQRKKGHQRVQSAKIVRCRKLSAKLQPWQMPDDLCEDGRFDKCI